MTQFSYAYWAGNPEDKKLRENIALDKLKGLEFQCDQFDPEIIIPIASNIYFCHEENKYLNDSINTHERTFNFIKKNTKAEPVVLFNNEQYNYPKSHDSRSSIHKYKLALEKTLNDETNFLKSKSVNFDELEKEGNKFVKELQQTNSSILKRFIKPTKIKLFDSDAIYELSTHGFNVCKKTSLVDVVISSECLLACFKYPYGLDSVQISGRIRKPKEGNYVKFYNFFRINHLKMRGINPNSVSYILSILFRKILFKLNIIRN